MMRTPSPHALRTNGAQPAEAPQPSIARHTRFEDLPQFLSVEEFRAFVGIGRSTVYDLLRRGEIPHAKFGRVVRIPKRVLRTYLEGQTQEA